MGKYKKCAVPDCEKEAKPGTYCWMHYARLRRTNRLDKDPYINKGQTCKMEGCNNPAKNKGVCVMHDGRWRRNGDPAIVTKPASVRGMICHIKGCGLDTRAANLCRKHYANYLFHRDKGRYISHQDYIERKNAE